MMCHSSSFISGILQHGVTSFCPTLVTSPADFYKRTLPKLSRRQGGKQGAQVLGAHVEGPFINKEKKGAHNPMYIQPGAPNGVETMFECYGNFDNVSIITVAPELPGILDLIPHIVEKNVVVSIGHSTANFALAEDAVSSF